MRKYYIIALGILISQVTFGQNEDDALRYSMADYQGSARYESMAGSFGALGADFSSIQSNPAGLARFSTSQFSFSLRNNLINTTSNFSNQQSKDFGNAFKVGTMGLVLTTDQSRGRSGITFSQITLGYTRVNNYHSNINISGRTEASLLHEFADLGTGIAPDNDNIYFERPFTTGLAYEVYLLNYDPSTQEYYSTLDNPNISSALVNQSRNIEKRGGMGDYNFGFSLNYLNRFYFGASANYRTVNYKEEYVHNETAVAKDEVDFEYFNYRYNLETKGGGLNLKFGFLYLHSEALRMGLAVETPSFLRLTDNWTARMDANIWNGTQYVSTFTDPSYIPTGEYEYKIWTPTKTKASIAYVFNMKGSINVDVEHVAYNTARLKSMAFNELSYDFALENQEVRNQYRNVLNLRIGGELSIGGTFFVRGGYAFLPSPYKKDISTNFATQLITTGIGKKWRNSQFDIAYKNKIFDQEYYMVNPAYGDVGTTIATASNSVIVSYTLTF
ncbi:hypothetical protein SAMN05216474_0209 [Lishizhenia tianjinensis]|uniref:Outer membrane protein transport protein (OMPP1/FadL/TodX) n=1 Tax=Lishizhenia tianjinensis TaxID=477690 RepID=A0A1I6XI38_9FLAO|nr:hypothetical protein [Lishizhenia tianjinensis]SFT37796.1 hypothetical protein SAMN05216474_0209 [Lishizhenia tianjinensis]